MSKQFLTQLNNLPLKDLPLCYIFLGDNDYYRKEIIKSLRLKFEQIGALDFDFWVGDKVENTLKECMETAFTLPFLSPKKVSIYQGLDSLEDDEKNLFTEYVNNPSRSACLCLFIKNKRPALGKIPGDVVEKITIEDSKEKLEKKDISDLILKYSKTISPKALDLLERSCSSDRIRLENSIEKLIAFVGDRGKIDIKDIQENFKEISSFNIFQLVDDIASGDKKFAINKLNNLLSWNTSFHEILGMFYWSFKRMGMAFDLKEQGLSNSEICARAGIKEWGAAKFFKQLSRFNKNSLGKVFNYLGKADFDLRNNPNLTQVLLEKLVLDITSL